MKKQTAILIALLLVLNPVSGFSYGSGWDGGGIAWDGSVWDSSEALYEEYIGPVASRSRFNNFFSTSSSVTYMQARTVHIARDDIDQAQLVFSGVYQAGATETGASIEGDILGASIEYPEGTFTRVTFGGIDTGTITPGANTISDMVTLTTPIPNGERFWVRNYVHWTGTNKLYSVDGLNWRFNAATGEDGEASSSPLTDRTMSGTCCGSGDFQNNIHRPTAILGYTRKATFFLAGDSRTRASGGGGNVDLNLNGVGSVGVVGEIERSLDARGFAYINGAFSGDSYFNVTQAGAYTARGEMAGYCKIILDNYGINDLGTSATISASTFNGYIGDLKSVTGLAGKPYYHTTLTPRATSTDNWSTLGNQTAVTSNTSRVEFNDALRAGTITNVDGYIEIADANESSRNSGKWRVDNGRVLTSDVSTTNGSKTITSAGGNFLSTDAGRPIQIAGVALRYIDSVTNSTTALLMINANATVANATAELGYATGDGLHNALDGDLNIVNSDAFDALNQYAS